MNTFADGYTTDDITYAWKETDPVQIAKNLSLPRFSIEEYSNKYCNVKTNTGKKIFIQISPFLTLLIVKCFRNL